MRSGRASRAATAGKRRAQVRRRPAGRAGRQESGRRGEPAREARSSRLARPGFCGSRRASGARRRAPPPVGGPGTWRRGGGVWLSAPGAGPGPGAPGRCRARLVRGRDRSPGHQGVRPPTGPAFPAAARPIRAAFTGGWAEPAQLLGGSGMVTSPRGGGGARGGPTAPPAARAGAGGERGGRRGYPGPRGRARGMRG